RSQRRVREARSRDPRAVASSIHLNTLIGGAIVFMHHAEFLRKAKETFRMSDKKIAAGIQAVIKLIDEALLFGFVEINHHVAAKNHVVAPRQEFSFEIVEVELDKFLTLRLEGVFVARFFEITEAAGVIHRLHLLLGVKTFL